MPPKTTDQPRRTEREVREGGQVFLVTEETRVVSVDDVPAKTRARAVVRESIDRYFRELFQQHVGERDPREDLADLILDGLDREGILAGDGKAATPAAPGPRG